MTLDFGDENVEILSRKLEEKYKGLSISAKALFEEHHPATKFCGSHYARTLRHMVQNDKVKSKFEDNRSHKVSVLLTDTCKLQFK